MVKASHIVAALTVFAAPCVVALPYSEGNDANALRYVPGDDLAAITRDMIYDGLSVFNLGMDGVLRIFANNLTVLDYRQLDPGQVKLFASRQIDQWQASGMNFPSPLNDLLKTEVDGRLTTDPNKLLNPEDKPNVPPKEFTPWPPKRGEHTPWPPKRGELTPWPPKKDFTLWSPQATGLEKRQPQVCPGSPACESLADCSPYNCLACYFQNGPPAGTCFVS